jgi:hypothetical protein
MSEQRQKVITRFEERLAALEARHPEKPARWLLHHLHNALDALESGDNADLHLNEFDRHQLEREYPELEADKVPSVDEIRARFTALAGGMV